VLHHVAVFTWKPGTSPEAVAALTAALDELRQQIPTLRRYAYGPDLGLTPAPGDYGVVASFDDEAGWRVYEDSPLHNRIRAELIAPHMASRLGLQFES
jgi:hypothetical protein